MSACRCADLAHEVAALSETLLAVRAAQVSASSALTRRLHKLEHVVADLTKRVNEAER